MKILPIHEFAYHLNKSQREKIRHHYLLLLFCIILGACESQNIFPNTPLVHATTFQHEIQLTGKKKDITPIGTLGLQIIDTFIISTQSNLPEYLGIYEKVSGRKIKDLLTIGRGPGEFLDCTFKGQYRKNKQNLELYFSDCNKGYFYALNLTQTLRQDSLNITLLSTIPYRSFPTFLTGNNYLSRAYFPEEQTILYLLHDSTGQTIRQYPLYKDVDWIRYNQIGSADEIKPDLSKIAMGMLLFNQINIVDLKGNQHFSVTTSDKSTYLSTQYLDEHEPIVYYSDLTCTDQYIYALYVNQKISDWQRITHPTEIHVFDWKGKAVYKLKTQETLLSIDIDETDQKIYGLATEEQIFTYDLPELLLP